MALSGGCLCGAVRFDVSAEPLGVTHCHCGSCRRTSGAAFSTWVQLPSDKVRFTKGKPARFPLSREARHGFCGMCGSSLTMQFVATPDLVNLALGSFDDPLAIVPSRHAWTESQLPWLRMDDGLPRHPRGPDDDNSA